MPQATVHLLRHGEVHNPDGVLYGRLPEFHLSELGREMARMLAEHFRERAAAGARITYLAASPLDRAQETAAPTAEALHLQIHTDAAHHRGRKLLRGHEGHQGRAAPAEALAAAGQPAAALLGRAVQGAGRPRDGRGPGRTPAGHRLGRRRLRRRRPRSHPGQPPAPHLGHPPQRGGQAALARSAQARMHPHLRHVPGVRRRRQAPARRVQRTGCRPFFPVPPAPREPKQ